jgi:hypothetical protein
MSGVVVPHRRWWRAGTTALFLGNGVLAGTFAANIPRIRLAHALSDAALGSVLLAFGLGAIVAMALGGTLAGRLGAARLAAIAGLLVGALFPLFALVAGRLPLLALAVVLGAVSGTMELCMNAYGAQLERRGGAPMMSSFHAGWSSGGLAGSMLSGVLAGLGWGLFATLAAGACVIAAGGLAGLALPALEDAPPPRRAFRLPSRRLAGLCLLAGLAFAAEGSVGDWFGVYLNTVVGTDAAWATTGYTAYALAMVAGRLGGDTVVGRLGPVRVVWLGAGLAALGLAAALAVPDRWTVDAGLVLVGAGLANVVPAVFSAAARLAGIGGVAMVSATGYASLLVAPPLIGGIADAVGLRLALALLPLATAGLMLLARSVGGRK